MSATATWEHHREDHIVVMTIEGEIDLSNCDDLERSIRRACASDEDELVLDLSGVSFIDSSGLRALYRGSGNGTGVRLRNPPPLVRRLLEIAMPNSFVIDEVDDESPARTLVEPEAPAIEPNEPA